jgi:hypothetical protein
MGSQKITGSNVANIFSQRSTAVLSKDDNTFGACKGSVRRLQMKRTVIEIRTRAEKRQLLGLNYITLRGEIVNLNCIENATATGDCRVVISN